MSMNEPKGKVRYEGQLCPRDKREKRKEREKKRDKEE